MKKKIIFFRLCFGLYIYFMKPRTLFDKIWESHVVDKQADGTCLLIY